MSKPSYHFDDDTHDGTPPIATLETLRRVILKSLAHALLREADHPGRPHQFPAGGQLDFYDEVHRFEIERIERALVQAGGKQKWAARLLGMKAPTLNAKIKAYHIVVTRFSPCPGDEPATTLSFRNHLALDDSEEV